MSPRRTGRARHPSAITGSQACYSLDDYRRRYSLYKLDADLQAAHRALAMFPPSTITRCRTTGLRTMAPPAPRPEIFLLRRAAALQAWYEHMPVRARSLAARRHDRHGALARSGTLLDLRLLDTRQFRTDQPCGGGFQPACAGVGRRLGPDRRAGAGKDAVRGARQTRDALDRARPAGDSDGPRPPHRGRAQEDPEPRQLGRLWPCRAPACSIISAGAATWWC